MAKLPVWQTIKAAYRDTSRGIATYPEGTWITFGCIIVAQLILGLFVDQSTTAGLRTWSLAALLTLVTSFITAPLMVAVHRLIILGEGSEIAASDLGRRRVLLFAGLAALTEAVTTLPFVFVGQPPSTTGAAVALLLLAVLVILFVHLTLLFPAIAIDAPGRSVHNAIGDAKGSAWRIFWSIMGAVIGPALLAGAVASALGYAFGEWWLTTVLAAVISAFSTFLTSILAVAAASNIYLQLGNRLAGRPA